MAEHKAILCEHCGKGFRNTSGLNHHLVTVHFGIKFKCRICSRDFTNKENLEIHLAVSHMKLCANDKEFRANRSQIRESIEEYMEKLSVKVLDSSLALITHPNGTQEEVRFNGERQKRNGWLVLEEKSD